MCVFSFLYLDEKSKSGRSFRSRDYTRKAKPGSDSGGGNAVLAFDLLRYIYSPVAIYFSIFLYRGSRT